MKKVSLFLFLVMALIGCDKDNVVNPTGKVTGKFSVSADKQVLFSPGNLQYTQSTNTWSFAEHQYDVIGKANVSGNALANKIDLFGWSGSNSTAPFGVSSSTDRADYAGDFVDWGTNKIGDDAPNTWRTLTSDEWYYLCWERADAEILIGVARINFDAEGIRYANGLILLPDNWASPKGVTLKRGFGGADFGDHQIIDLPVWQKLESSGAVFIPCGGTRDELDVMYGGFGYYWTATSSGGNTAWHLFIGPSKASTYADSDTSYDKGLSVRLVQDVK